MLFLISIAQDFLIAIGTNIPSERSFVHSERSEEYMHEARQTDPSYLGVTSMGNNRLINSCPKPRFIILNVASVLLNKLCLSETQ